MPERKVEGKTGVPKIYFADTNDKEPQTSVEDRIQYPGNFISQMSINGLYNFLVTPKTAAGNLYLLAGFVSF